MALVPSSKYDDWKLNPWKYDPIKWDPWELDLYDHWKRVEDWFDWPTYSKTSPYYYRDYWRYPYYRRRSSYSDLLSTPGSAIDDAREVWSSIGQHGFHVDIDVHAFRPSEIQVKTTADNYIVIEGHHEEHPTRVHHVRKHFMKKYALPVGFTTRDVSSTISKDGILTVKCSPPFRALPSTNRWVPIDYK